MFLTVIETPNQAAGVTRSSRVVYHGGRWPMSLVHELSTRFSGHLQFLLITLHIQETIIIQAV